MRDIKKLINVPRHKNKNIGFYPKSLRPVLRILCVVDDSIYAHRRNFSCAPGDLARKRYVNRIPFICVIDDSMYACSRNFSCAPGDLARNSD